IRSSRTGCRSSTRSTGRSSDAIFPRLLRCPLPGSLQIPAPRTTRAPPARWLQSTSAAVPSSPSRFAAWQMFYHPVDEPSDLRRGAAGAVGKGVEPGVLGGSLIDQLVPVGDQVLGGGDRRALGPAGVEGDAVTAIPTAPGAQNLTGHGAGGMGEHGHHG